MCVLWSLSDFSSSSRSERPPAAPSQIERESEKSRFCSIIESRTPGCRAIVPEVGSERSASRLNSVVFPDPFRQIIPQRSPLAMVNVTLVKRVVAPNCVPTLDVDIRVNPYLRDHRFRDRRDE